jgi:hypothetical protein
MVPTKLQAVLAGIAAGAIGGATVLAFMTLAALANDDPWWRYANLLGSAFYGARALRAGPGLATIGGSGLQIVTSGAVGAVFALVFGRAFPARRLALIGAVTGLAWMYAAGSLTGRFAPLIPLYTPTVAATTAYLLFGLCLGMVRWFLPAAKASAPPPPESQSFTPGDSADEPRP